MTQEIPLLHLNQVAKRFPNGTVALRGVDLVLQPGRVHGLLGANGAGKSTLIKIISGLHPRSGGRIVWKGREVDWCTPKAANDMGVATIHQHIPLVPALSVLENVFLSGNSFWRRTAAARRRFAEISERVDYWLDPDARVGDLAIGQRQMVAIFQALAADAELIIMDEPTASLAGGERERVYHTVQRLSRVEHKAILFVSHFLDEVVALTDCLTVLRDGQTVLHAETCDMDEARIAEAIVGKQIAALDRAPAASAPQEPTEVSAPAVLELDDLASPGRLAPVSLTLRPGEVLGLAGLLGSGRSELLHAIYGADCHATGSVRVNGAPLARTTPAAVKAGLALVPEDRMAQGLIPGFELWRNLSLPGLADLSRGRMLPVHARERERSMDIIARLSVKTRSPDALVSQLSGGNAQKITIGKWLSDKTRVFLLDEPTAGIDIGARTDVLLLVRRLAAEGMAVIIASSDFEELLAVSTRIMVLRDGRCVAERRAADTSEHELLLLAGGTADAGHATASTTT